MAKDTTVSRVDYGDPSPIGRKHSRRRVAPPPEFYEESMKNPWAFFSVFKKETEIPKSEGGELS